MAVLTVTAGCRGCGACLLTCPEHAIRPSEWGARRLLVRADLCTGCGECVEVCPVDAIRVDAIRVDAMRVDAIRVDAKDGVNAIAEGVR